MLQTLQMSLKKTPWLSLFLWPSLVYFSVVLPLVDLIFFDASHWHLFAFMTLALVPSIGGALFLGLVLSAYSLSKQCLDRWQYTALSPILSLVQWGVMMGVVALSLFVLPAKITEGITGAFYYYMVPLQGVWIGAICLNWLVFLWAHSRDADHVSHGSAWSKRARLCVLSILPLMAVIYYVFHFVFFELIF